jgi:hypothetical protein
VYLFNAAGQVVNLVEFGFQVPDLSIGLSGGQWRLLASPTPGAANSRQATLGATSNLRVNEWMADPRAAMIGSNFTTRRRAGGLERTLFERRSIARRADEHTRRAAEFHRGQEVL